MRAALFCLILAAGPAIAAELDLGAPGNAERTAYVVRGSDNYALPMGPVDATGDNLLAISGRTVWAAYKVTGGAAPESILAGYRDRLAGLGFEPEFECWSMSCGGFDFRFGVTVLPAPHMRMDVQAFGQMSAVRKTPPAYASVLVSAVQGVTFVQTVAVTPRKGAAVVAPAPVSRSEQAEAVAAIAPGEARELGDMLRANGHVAIDGLAFATGGASLTRESADALDALARMLTRDAALEVVIVGHSDSEGALDSNITLSRRRAEAVRAALLERGVPAKQLDARGVGYLAPLTSNATEEGRLRNRRVELVLR
ncbi:MAG: OmpA family protein [Paracoccaceae bacterium]